MSQRAPWTVGEVADLTRLSIRTLHHYDAIGLLRPSGRSEGNYRLYTPADLGRLHRVLTFRDLGFPLAEIARLLDAQESEQLAALNLRAALLRTELGRVQRQLEQVTSLLGERPGEGAFPMNNDDIKEIFDGFDHQQYEPEVQERWGDTDAYRQSAERTRRYTRADWTRIKAEGEALNAQYTALMDRGVSPTSPEAQAVAAEHRAYFQRWFYDPSVEMMRGLAAMWVQDERFTRNIDKTRSGLAAYQSAAVTAWADAQG